jgi:hypothetical protein
MGCPVFAPDSGARRQARLWNARRCSPVACILPRRRRPRDAPAEDYLCRDRLARLALRQSPSCLISSLTIRAALLIGAPKSLGFASPTTAAKSVTTMILHPSVRRALSLSTVLKRHRPPIGFGEGVEDRHTEDLSRTEGQAGPMGPFCLRRSVTDAQPNHVSCLIDCDADCWEARWVTKEGER